jgi:hypothetical protein
MIDAVTSVRAYKPRFLGCPQNALLKNKMAASFSTMSSLVISKRLPHMYERICNDIKFTR